MAWPQRGWRVTRAAVALLLVCGVVILAPAGCGATTRSPATTAPAPPDSSPPPSTEARAELVRAFERMAEAMAPVPVYGLPDLPAGSRMNEEWWPAIDVADSSEYQSERQPNPHVTGVGSDEPQGQLLLQLDEGWLVVFENFRGDLGDVEGEVVGSIAGREAVLYAANGGDVVQWSDNGRWYGVFARGLPSGRLVDVALSMRLVEPPSWAD